MTSREEIALQLTKSVVEKTNISRYDDAAQEISNIYNTIYKNIETHETDPMTIL